MIGLLAFTLSLSINFAQNRYETRRAGADGGERDRDGLAADEADRRR